jgi:hypothetical protein
MADRPDVRPMLDPEALAAQLQALEAMPCSGPEQVIVVQIGLVQMKLLLEVALLSGQVQGHDHLPYVLQGLHQSIACEVPGMSAEMRAGRYEVLSKLFALISGLDYDLHREALDEMAAADRRTHLTLVRPD